MAIPAQSGVQWAVDSLRNGSSIYTVTFTAASQVTDILELYDRTITTVHVFGTFNSQTVTLQGFNVNSASSTPLTLHREDSLASSFDTVSADLLANIVENPRYLVAKSDGAVTSVTVALVVVNRV